jgi:outer membrane protein OmpA-like peptidoglycan-associated protein
MIVVGGLMAGLMAGIAQAAARPVLDTDGDGIADAADDCPQSPAGARVDAKGCALDEDVDGVADGLDLCPASAFGAVVNADGCTAAQKPKAGLASRAPANATKPGAAAAPSRAAGPLPVLARPPAVALPKAPDAASEPSQIVILSEPERTFYFHEGDAELSWAARRSIKQSAQELLPELEKNASMNLVLSGHGDTKSDGPMAPRLATSRARAVRDFLVASGVPQQRISMRVPGAGEPRYFGASLGRNCRVELRIVNGPAPVTQIPVFQIRNGMSGAPPVTLPVVVPAPVVVAKPAPPPAPAAVPKPPEPAADPSPPPAAMAPPARAERSVSQASISFAPYSAVLDAASVKTLEDFVKGGARAIRSDTSARVVVTGGIDATEIGPPATQLAESRAATVRAKLVALGVARTSVDVSAKTPTAARRADVSIVVR